MNTNSSGDCYFSFSFFLWIYVLRALVLRNLPLGWRFHPSDEELVGYYLMRKRRGDPFDNLVDISEVQLCDHDPWDLPGLSKNQSGDKIWYFFCPREYYNKNRRLVKRQTPTGHWKCTGETYSVTREESDEEIGIRRILVFENPGATPWVIHEYEYTAELDLPIQGNFVLCKLMIKTNKKKMVIKKKKKAEPDCKNAKPNKKARKSKSDCNIASASAPAVENSNSRRVMTNSAYGDGELSNHMISDVDNQNLSTTAAFAANEKGEPSYVEALAHGIQSQYEMTSISTSNKGDCTSTWMASEFDLQPEEEFIALWDLEDCPNSAAEQHIYNNSNLQNLSTIAASATYEKGESSYPEALAYNSQSQYEMTPISTSNKGETSRLEASSFENFYQVIDVSACNKGETRCPVASDLKDNNPNEMTPMSSYMKITPSCPRASGLENQNSYEMTIVPINNKGYETSCFKTFDFENQNSYDMTNEFSCDNGKPSYLITSDFENQNPGKCIDISASTEDCLSPSMPSNVGEATFQGVYSQHNTLILDDHRDISTAFSTQEGGEAMLKKVQNQYNKDMAILEDNCPWMASYVGEDTFHEMDLQPEEELMAFRELEDCLNSAPEQHIHNNNPQ